MKNRIIAVFSLLVLSLNLVVPSLADSKKRAGTQLEANSLALMLPASDAVVTIDARRFFNEALPAVLTGSPKLLERVSASMNEMQTSTGIDLRQFESIAVGVNIKKISAKDFDVAPVAIARGQINTAALIGVAKIGFSGKFREEELGVRRMYVFAIKDLAPPVKPKIAGASRSTAGTKSKKPSLSKSAAATQSTGKPGMEMAIAAFDANTLLIGTPARLRETVGNAPRLAPDIIALLGNAEGSIVQFASKVPESLGGLVPMENDVLGKNINSIRFIYGNMSAGTEKVSMRMAAQTELPAQAQGLYETLSGLHMIGKTLLGSSKLPEKEILVRLADSVKLAVAGSEVSVELSVPTSDIANFAATIK